MATQWSGPTGLSGKILAALLREREVVPRAQLIAQQAVEFLAGGAVVVYLLEDHEEGQVWSAKATSGEIHLDDQIIPLKSGTLGVLAEQREALLFAGNELAREEYAHLHARRTPVSLAYVPIVMEESLMGCLEAASFEGPITQADVAALQELAEYAGSSLASAVAYEQERNSHLESISRLAQLYDLEKVFNSTLEMDDLLPIVASKCREILNAQAVNLWLVKDENELLLLNREGEDPSVPLNTVQKSGEGIAAQASDSGEPVLIEDPDDERLRQRNARVAGGGVFSLMAMPVIAQGNQVGVVEVINKLDGTPFHEDDLFLLNSVAETAGGALHNASLLQAERKVEILETLVQVSTEITSTLNLDRVLQAVVTLPGSVIPYERAAIALEQRGKMQVKAISGMTQVNPGDPEVERLKEILQWAALSGEEVFIKQQGEEIEGEREETKAKFSRYFSETSMRGFYALPLADDEGRVGVLSFESSDPDFLTEAHLEMIRILAGQATVALRNASFYKEVPFITVLEPILQRKKKFLAQDKKRRTLTLAMAGAVVLFFAAFPIPMRLDGNASVGSARTAQVQPEVEGVVRQVHVREGQAVKAGEVLADLQDWQYRSALAAAQAKYETANSEMNRALASNDGSEAGILRVQAGYWLAEVQRARERLERTHVRAPIGGFVTTPHLEDFEGRHLDAGENLAQIVDNSEVTLDVAIAERDVTLLRQGAQAAVKLDAFPLRTFRGTVGIVGPKSEVEGEERVFYARVTVPNADGPLRPGMQGRGKISAGWRPVGYVLFRRPAMWIYSKLWSWLGW
jgi:RND family efflux transporter MFP subunit